MTRSNMPSLGHNATTRSSRCSIFSQLVFSSSQAAQMSSLQSSHNHLEHSPQRFQSTVLAQVLQSDFPQSPHAIANDGGHPGRSHWRQTNAPVQSKPRQAHGAACSVMLERQSDACASAQLVLLWCYRFGVQGFQQFHQNPAMTGRILLAPATQGFAAKFWQTCQQVWSSHYVRTELLNGHLGGATGPHGERIVPIALW